MAKPLASSVGVLHHGDHLPPGDEIVGLEDHAVLGDAPTVVAALIGQVVQDVGQAQAAKDSRGCVDVGEAFQLPAFGGGHHAVHPVHHGEAVSFAVPVPVVETPAAVDGAARAPVDLADIAQTQAPGPYILL
jgi:hypothetical protein